MPIHHVINYFRFQLLFFRCSSLVNQTLNCTFLSHPLARRPSLSLRHMSNQSFQSAHILGTSTQEYLLLDTQFLLHTGFEGWSTQIEVTAESGILVV